MSTHVPGVLSIFRFFSLLFPSSIRDYIFLMNILPELAYVEHSYLRVYFTHLKTVAYV